MTGLSAGHFRPVSCSVPREVVLFQPLPVFFAACTAALRNCLPFVKGQVGFEVPDKSRIPVLGKVPVKLPQLFKH